jgi:hypothetical protein
MLVFVMCCSSCSWDICVFRSCALPKRRLLLYLHRYHLGNSVGSLMLLLVALQLIAIGLLNTLIPPSDHQTTTLLKVVFPVLVTANVYVITSPLPRTWYSSYTQSNGLKRCWCFSWCVSCCCLWDICVSSLWSWCFTKALFVTYLHRYQLG